jgi:SP family sugar:H+ symporter-like MFS transporter
MSQLLEKPSRSAHVLSRHLSRLLSIGLVSRSHERDSNVANISKGNFLIGFLTPYATEGIGYAFGFVFFACNFIAAGVVYFFLFETRSLSLESVDMMYSDGRIKPRTSKKWVPPGYITRLERDDAYWHRNAESKGVAAGENHYEKDDSSPERGMSMHREHADNGVRV